MMRRFFLFLSGHQGVRRWMETSPLSKKFTRRFIAGETLEDALAACANLGSLFAARAADRSKETALRLAPHRPARPGRTK